MAVRNILLSPNLMKQQALACADKTEIMYSLLKGEQKTTNIHDAAEKKH